MVTVDKFEYCSHEWVGFSQNNSHDKNIQQILYVCVYVCVDHFPGMGVGTLRRILYNKQSFTYLDETCDHVQGCL